ncbi:MAG: HTH-type transcriptional regulator CysB [Gammaproteobacteria bacterium]|nr:HTH-type transcriptional regulator CysB [Gammaproteobacteria bacterium]
MKLKQLEYLLETYNQNLNMSEAARVLNTTQPGISNGIKRLEQELGVDLLTRKGKRLGMTPAGERIVALAREALQKVDSIERAAEEFVHEDRGSLRIATTHTQARYVLPDHIRNFREKYPHVSLHINQGTPAQLAELTLNGEADFAIATEGFEHFTSLILVPCYTWNRSIVVPREHPLTRVDKMTLVDVAREPLVTYVFGFAGGSSVATAFTRAGLSANVTFTATDTDVIKKYVRLGVGIGIIASMAREQGVDDDLEFLDASHLFEPSVTHIGLRREIFLRSYMYEFIESFADHLKRPLIEKVLATARRDERDALLSGFTLPSR